jgi:hypothetical protein
MRIRLWQTGSRLSIPVVALLIISLGLCDPSPAAEFSCGAGDVACLIAAINTANASGEANTITLEAGTYTLTAVNNNTGGPNGLPVITSPFPLTIQGAGAEVTSIDRSASAPPFRIFLVEDTGTLTLNGLTIRGGAVPSDANGGGINNAGMLTIRNSTITGNTAGFVGGGIVAEGTVIITDSTITDNTADRGAGIYFGASVTLTITNSTIARNRATFLAGGGVMGGGIGLEVTVTITNSTLADNSASVRGGAINLEAGTLTITNSTIGRNQASGFGGAIFIESGTVTLTNSTVADNVAVLFGSPVTGGGILNSGGTVRLQNTILARNMGDPPDCSGPVTSLGHNLIGDPTGCTITLQATDLTGDPDLGAFTDDRTPGKGHFPLLEGSPAIDAGDDQVCPATDQLGQPRVGVCDIGAIEFQPPAGEVIVIRRAIFVNQLALLVLVATSSAAPDAELFVTVPGCLTHVPMLRIDERYLFLRAVPACGDLDGQVVTVTSSGGGSASALLR